MLRLTDVTMGIIFCEVWKMMSQRLKADGSYGTAQMQHYTHAFVRV